MIIILYTMIVLLTLHQDFVSIDSVTFHYKRGYTPNHYMNGLIDNNNNNNNVELTEFFF